MIRVLQWMAFAGAAIVAACSPASSVTTWSSPAGGYAINYDTSFWTVQDDPEVALRLMRRGSERVRTCALSETRVAEQVSQAELNTLTEIALQTLVVPDVADEQKSLDTLGGAAVSTHRFSLPSDAGQVSLIRRAFALARPDHVVKVSMICSATAPSTEAEQQQLEAVLSSLTISETP